MVITVDIDRQGIAATSTISHISAHYHAHRGIDRHAVGPGIYGIREGIELPYFLDQVTKVSLAHRSTAVVGGLGRNLSSGPGERRCRRPRISNIYVVPLIPLVIVFTVKRGVRVRDECER